jgi:hypothetical protein
MADLAADTVAERLRDRATRSAALTALERHDSGSDSDGIIRKTLQLLV